MKEIKRNIIAFFGDSLTEGFPGVSFFNILKEKFSDDELINLGKGGDTVISLYRRIKGLIFDKPFDISFLWIGTNDIFVKVSREYPVIKTLMKQPWAKNIEEFNHYYHLILEFLRRISTKVVTVSPLFLGENFNNPWNKELLKLSKGIQEQSELYKDVSYINLREFFKMDSINENENYIAKHSMRVVLDALILKQKEQVDKKSSDRGLFYTLDGIHLNSKGAELVSDIFYNQIMNIL